MTTLASCMSVLTRTQTQCQAVLLIQMVLCFTMLKPAAMECCAHLMIHRKNLPVQCVPNRRYYTFLQFALIESINTVGNTLCYICALHSLFIVHITFCELMDDNLECNFEATKFQTNVECIQSLAFSCAIQQIVYSKLFLRC